MTEEQSGTLVLKDVAGSYFVLTPDVLEAARVPDERAAEIERLMAEPGDDVHGHQWFNIELPGGRTVSFRNEGTAADIAAMARLVGTALGGSRPQ